MIDIPPHTCELAQSSVSSQVQSYPPSCPCMNPDAESAAHGDGASAGRQVHEPQANKTNSSPDSS